MSDDAILRKHQAETLLNDPLLREAFDTADKQCVAAWRNASTPEMREGLWHAQLGIREAERVLRGIISNGEFEENKAAKIAKRSIGPHSF